MTESFQIKLINDRVAKIIISVIKNKIIKMCLVDILLPHK